MERRSLNLFTYEVKTNFDLCYANAWVSIIPWLCQHRGLDPVSEQFLRVWHHQNQPRQDDPAGLSDPRAAFSGQVLALHPLSGFLMRDRALLDSAGRYFGSGAAEVVANTGRADDCDAYWDLIQALLIAAHQYRQLDREQAGQRGVVTRNDRNQSVDNHPEADQSTERSSEQENMLEEFLANRGDRCSCGGELRFDRIELALSDQERVSVDFACRRCQQTSTFDLDGAELGQWARSRDQDPVEDD